MAPERWLGRLVRLKMQVVQVTGRLRDVFLFVAFLVLLFWCFFYFLALLRYLLGIIVYFFWPS